MGYTHYIWPMNEDTNLYVVYSIKEDTTAIHTTKAQACRQAHINVATLTRALVTTNHYQSKLYLILYTKGIAKCPSRVANGKHAIRCKP